jgi:hypothetical protein
MPEYLAQGTHSAETLERFFDIGDILSITTGLLVSKRRMEGVKDILSFMLGRNIDTKETPDAYDVCRPALLLQLPKLAGEELKRDVKRLEEKLRTTVNEQKGSVVDAWVNEQAGRYGRTLLVKRINKNPFNT